jgi:hypothetical protein
LRDHDAATLRIGTGTDGLVITVQATKNLLPRRLLAAAESLRDVIVF